MKRLLPWVMAVVACGAPAAAPAIAPPALVDSSAELSMEVRELI